MQIRDAHDTLTVHNADVSDARFTDVKLKGASFDDVDLQRAAFINVNLRNTTFVNVNLTNVSIKSANLTGTKINGVPVYDMIQAYESRAKSAGGAAS